MQDNVASLVREAETNYISGTTTISKHVDFSLYDTLNRIDAYSNSKHISGDTDSMGREKPFFNIVTATTNIWYRATDIDRKNIRIKPTKREDVLKSFIATIHLQDYMRRDNFGTFLNEWGRSLAKYGSTVLKFIETEGQLHSRVVTWNTLIVDDINIDNDIVIEKLDLTEAQLKQQKGYNQEVVNGLLDTVSAREGMDQQDRDTKNKFITVYEVHGQLPLSLITEDEEDEETLVQQMHVISYVATDNDGEYDDFTLVKGREKKNPYMMTSLIKEDDRVLGIGSVEHLFEAQWMVNHTAKSIKDQLDLASKLIFQTSDTNYIGRNALTAIENGEILTHEPNQPLTQLANSSHDITSLQNFGQQWQVLAKEISSTPDAIAGNTFPSGTAYRQVVALQQEAHSLFQIMTENKGLDIEKMMREYIIPFIKKKMDSTEEIVVTLDEQGVKKIDSLYIPNEAVRRANRKVIEEALKGNPLTQEDQAGLIAEEEEAIRQAFAADGNQRFLKPSEIADKTWKEALDGLEWDVIVEVTGEQSDKEAVMTTLTTVLQTIVSNPSVLQDPNAKLLFNKILTSTGEVSPIELAEVVTPAPEQLASPSGVQVEANLEELETVS